MVFALGDLVKIWPKMTKIFLSQNDLKSTQDSLSGLKWAKFRGFGHGLKNRPPWCLGRALVGGLRAVLRGFRRF